MLERAVNIVGAGPAGLSAAIGLARAGYQPTVYEQRLRWAGRVCGCFFSPEAVRHLEWLGVLGSVRREAVEVAQSTLTWDRFTANVPVGRPGAVGLSLSRQRLELILMDEVERRQIRVIIGKTPPDADALTVLASGRFATIEKSFSSPCAWYGWNATFTGARQNPGQMAMHFFVGGYVGTVTYADGTTNVCGLSLNPDRSQGWNSVFVDALDRSPAFRAQMEQARITGEWRGVGPLPFASSMRSSQALLAGDAAAVGDPFMGEGNSRALAAGPMLHTAAQRGESMHAIYNQLWARAYESRLRAGAGLRWLLERPALARQVLPWMWRRPLFSRRLSPLFHSGYFL
jgi:flavin-dependent dehydrogenase